MKNGGTSLEMDDFPLQGMEGTVRQCLHCQKKGLSFCIAFCYTKKQKFMFFGEVVW
jgi:hypothetical protein